MKAVLFLKCVVFTLTFLLLIGFSFVAYKIADVHQQGKIKTQEPVVFPINYEKKQIFTEEKTNVPVLQDDEEIITAFSCSEDVCLITKNAEKQNHIFVIYPQTGTLKKVINLNIR